MAVFGLVLGFILDLIKGTTGWFLPIFMCVGLSIVITAIAFWYNRDQLR